MPLIAWMPCLPLQAGDKALAQEICADDRSG
jgi:hypothetical protein